MQPAVQQSCEELGVPQREFPEMVVAERRSFCGGNMRLVGLHGQGAHNYPCFWVMPSCVLLFMRTTMSVHGPDRCEGMSLN